MNALETCTYYARYNHYIISFYLKEVLKYKTLLVLFNCLELSFIMTSAILANRKLSLKLWIYRSDWIDIDINFLYTIEW